MLTVENILLLLAAYLLGSVPTAVWLGQLVDGKDVREFGSGNAGATNTFRVLGAKVGVPVLLIDILKGAGAVLIPYLFSEYEPGTIPFVNFQLAMGIAAVIGHIFPIYVGFRGGKGIATLLGIMIAIHFYAAISALVIFLLIFGTTRYVSLGSMIAAVSFPFIVILLFKSTIPSLIIFSIFIAIMVLVTHQKNIERLMRREESKANISFRKIFKSNDEDED